MKAIMFYQFKFNNLSHFPLPPMTYSCQIEQIELSQPYEGLYFARVLYHGTFYVFECHDTTLIDELGDWMACACTQYDDHRFNSGHFRYNPLNQIAFDFFRKVEPDIIPADDEFWKHHTSLSPDGFYIQSPREK